MSIKFDPTGKHCIASVDWQTPCNKLMVAVRMKPGRTADADDCIYEHFGVKSVGCVNSQKMRSKVVTIMTYDTTEQATLLRAKYNMNPRPDGTVFFVQFANEPKKVQWTTRDQAAHDERMKKSKEKKEKK